MRLIFLQIIGKVVRQRTNFFAHQSKTNDSAKSWNFQGRSQLLLLLKINELMNCHPWELHFSSLEEISNSQCIFLLRSPINRICVPAVALCFFFLEVSRIQFWYNILCKYVCIELKGSANQLIFPLSSLWTSLELKIFILRFLSERSERRFH